MSALSTPSTPLKAAYQSAPGAAWSSAPLGRSGEVVASSTASQPALTLFYVGQWVGEDSGADVVWVPEVEVDEWFDLRTEAQQATPPEIGTTACCLFAVTSETIPLTPGWQQISASRTGLAVDLRLLEVRLGLPFLSLSAESVSDLAFELLVEDANPRTGRSPLLPNRNLVWTKQMSGDILFNVTVDKQSQAYTQVVREIQDGYARLRSHQMESGGNKHLMWLYVHAGRLRADYHDFLNGLPDEGIVRPATPQTEDFDCGAADELDCDLNWTETTGDIDLVDDGGDGVASNPSSTNSFAYVDNVDLSSADHYVQFVVQQARSFQGALGRWDGASEDGFRARMNSATDVRLFDCVSASCSQICNETATTINDGDTFRVEFDGTDIDIVINGSATYCDATTDSSHSDHVEFGLYGFTADAYWDDVEADILAAAAAGRRVIVID